MIKKLHYKPKGGDELNSNTILELYGHYKCDREFIEKANQYKFPRIKKFKIQRADCISSFDIIENTNKLLCTSFIYPMRYFKLSGWEYKVNLNKFIDGLSQLLQIVQKQIYFSNCVLDEDIFETIIEVSIPKPALLKFS